MTSYSIINTLRSKFEHHVLTRCVAFTILSADPNKEDRLTLNLLGAIEQQDDVSQRHLAEHMGVALGMANSYLKRCVKKGWIKVTTAPANRYLYYLTPTGFAEKARLTGEFLTTSLALVRQSGQAYTDFFDSLDNQQPIVFVGLSDLTEMAYLRALRLGLSIHGVFVPNIAIEGEPVPTQLPHTWFEMPVTNELPESWQQAVFVFTSLEHGYETAAYMRELYPQFELFIPEFLSLVPAGLPLDAAS